MKHISVVIPVFNEQDNLRELHRRLRAALHGEPEAVELIFVDDGSTDSSVALLIELQQADPSVQVLCLSRNFGHQHAITAGIDHAHGDAIIIMDADLQDPPEVLPTMLEHWRQGFDVVYGVREQRDGEGPIARALPWLFYRALQLITPLDLPTDVGDFRLLSKRAAQELRGLREQGRFLRGLTTWIGLRQASVSFRRAPRHAGRSRFGIGQRLKLASDAVFALSSWPVRAIWAAGSLTTLAGLGIAAWGAMSSLDLAPRLPTTDPLLLAALLLVGGAQLLGVAVIGSYASRIFAEVRGRPLYVVQAHYRSIVAAPAARLAQVADVRKP